MARILYGVTGEGFGHSTRSKEVIRHLEEMGHEVKVVTYDKGYTALAPIFDVTEISGLHLFYRNNKVQYIETVFKNFLKIKEVKDSLDIVLKLIKDFKPQIIFTDLEPLVGLAANLKRIPMISLDNMHCLTEMKCEFPAKYRKEYLTAKAVVRMMVYNAKAYLVLDAFGGKSVTKKGFIFPPIVREEVEKLKVNDKNYILVYLTSAYTALVDVLKKVDQNFVFYGLDRDDRDGNIQYKKISMDGFLADLANCSAIIANAGFSLISEALYLGKPYLAIPVDSQFEQILNAYYLDKFGYGKYYENLNVENIEEFLRRLDQYRKNLKNYKREGNGAIFRKVDELIVKYVKK